MAVTGAIAFNVRSVGNAKLNWQARSSKSRNFLAETLPESRRKIIEILEHDEQGETKNGIGTVHVGPKRLNALANNLLNKSDLSMLRSCRIISCSPNDPKNKFLTNENHESRTAPVR